MINASCSVASRFGEWPMPAIEIRSQRIAWAARAAVGLVLNHGRKKAT